MSAFWIQRAARFTPSAAGLWGREQAPQLDGQGLPVWEETGGRIFERYPRLDPLSKLICWLVERVPDAAPLAADAGMLLATQHGSVEADLAYYRTAAQTPDLASPQWFPYTLASAGLASAAIRHGLRGPAVVLRGDQGFTAALSQAWHWLQAEAMDQCLLISADAVLAAAAVFLSCAHKVEGHVFVLSRKAGAWPIRRKGSNHVLTAADLWSALGNSEWQHPDWSLR